MVAVIRFAQIQASFVVVRTQLRSAASNCKLHFSIAIEPFVHLKSNLILTCQSRQKMHLLGSWKLVERIEWPKINSQFTLFVLFSTLCLSSVRRFSTWKQSEADAHCLHCHEFEYFISNYRISRLHASMILKVCLLCVCIDFCWIHFASLNIDRMKSKTNSFWFVDTMSWQRIRCASLFAILIWFVWTNFGRIYFIHQNRMNENGTKRTRNIVWRFVFLFVFSVYRWLISVT